MLEPYEARIGTWLEAEPTLSAVTVLQRLMGADPSRFTKKSLRTVQLAVRHGARKRRSGSSSTATGRTARVMSAPPRSVTFFGEAIEGVKSSLRLTGRLPPSALGMLTRHADGR